MKLGLKPFTPDPRDLQFGNYRTGAPLPTHPARFGHENVVKDWGMLGNDKYGCCVFAGAAHEHMLWSRIGDAPDAVFSEETVLHDYGVVTGFNPNDPSTDQGTDMRVAAKYRKNVGITDVKGNKHKIGAYMFFNGYESFLEAVWLFGAAAVGFNVPQSAMDQFNAGKVWSVVPGSRIEGGHYVPGVDCRLYPEFVTWGKRQGMTPVFFNRYVTTGVVYLSEEFLVNGKSPEGFDLATLRADLAKIK